MSSMGWDGMGMGWDGMGAGNSAKWDHHGQK